jgi:4-amino-4-deoxy-L-arabinose transferase-like glycosyltransferase
MSRTLLSVLAIALFLSFFRLGSVPLFDVDEAVFATATKEMVESGDWITPTYNGVNRYDKPILFYWFMALSYKIFGVNEFSARFPSAVAASVLVLAIFLFLRHLRSETIALNASLSMAVSVYFLVYSHAAVTDMMLTLFITLSLLSFYLSLTEKTTARKRFSIQGFYLFSALSFLTKGLIGILFPFGIALTYLFATEGVQGVKKAFSGRGIILFLMVSVPWYMAQMAINGQEFIQQFFMKHHFMRYTGVISGHRGPVYYFIPVLIIGLLPWIGFLPGGIKGVFKRTSPPENHNAPCESADKLCLFVFLWFIMIVAFFSFSTTKLPNYILPAVPAASVLISFGMEREDRWRSSGYLFIAVISLLMGFAFLISKRYLLQYGFLDTGWTLIAAAILFSVAALGCYAVSRKKTFPIAMAVLMAFFLSLLSLKALPLANQVLQGTLHKYSIYARDRLQRDELFIVYGINNPSIAFYSGHKLKIIDNREHLLPLLEQGGRSFIITKAKETEALEQLGFHLIEKEGTYAILERH